MLDLNSYIALHGNLEIYFIHSIIPDIWMTCLPCVQFIWYKFSYGMRHCSRKVTTHAGVAVFYDFRVYSLFGPNSVRKTGFHIFFWFQVLFQRQGSLLFCEFSDRELNKLRMLCLDFLTLYLNFPVSLFSILKNVLPTCF